jgi:radical SAM superfamily enzyme YgiQ (UPF0313 family)
LYNYPEKCKPLSRRGIRTTAFNILGVPGETRKTLMETVRLNALARPDEFTNVYFYPFAGTVHRRVRHV